MHQLAANALLTGNRHVWVWINRSQNRMNQLRIDQSHMAAVPW